MEDYWKDIGVKKSVPIYDEEVLKIAQQKDYFYDPDKHCSIAKSELKIGTSSSGNFGHGGRPGQVGGSTPSSKPSASGLNLSGKNLNDKDLSGRNMNGANLRKTIVQGPFANDATANTGGVLVSQLYYTAAGDVKVRLT